MTDVLSAAGAGGRPRAGGVVTVALAALLVLPLAACTAPADPAAPDVAAGAAAVALATPPPGPSAAPSVTPPPEPGTVVILDGPFLDRMRLDLTLADGQVRGTVDVTADVSELLALELDVAWYDAAGRLLGSQRHVVDPELAEEYHTTQGVVGLPVEVAAPDAVSATVAVPVLVNE